MPVGFISSEKTLFCHRRPAYLCFFPFKYCTISSTSTQYYCTSCRILRPKCSGFDPTAFRYCTTLPPSCRRCPLLVFGLISFIDIALQKQYYGSTPRRMQVGCGSWIRWLVSRTRSCADKLEGGWERDKVQRTANRYDDDGHGYYVGLRLLLLVAVMAPRVFPPQTNRQR